MGGRLIGRIARRLGLRDVHGGIDIIGDIAILRLRGLPERLEKQFSEMICSELKHVKVVYRQVGEVSGEYRVWRLRWIYGEGRSLTIHKENGYRLMVDVEKVFFTPRLQQEHLRIAKAVRPGERVLNMFSGVGGFSIAIAVHSAPLSVTGIDLNWEAAKLHSINAKLNNVSQLVETVNADSRHIAEASRGRYDRVLMPLPMLAKSYLRYALMAVKKGGWIHVYDFYTGGNKREAVKRSMEDYMKILRGMGVEVSIAGRALGSVAPFKYRVVLDIRVLGH